MQIINKLLLSQLIGEIEDKYLDSYGIQDENLLDIGADIVESVTTIADNGGKIKLPSYTISLDIVRNGRVSTSHTLSCDFTKQDLLKHCPDQLAEDIAKEIEDLI